MIRSRARRLCRLGPSLILALAWAVIPVRAESAPITEQEDRQARSVLIRWLEAIGGADELRDLRTVFFQCQIRYGPAAAPLPLQVRAVKGGRYRYEYQLPATGRLVQAFDGSTAWQYNELLGFGFMTRAEHESNLFATDFQAPLRTASLFPGRRLLPEETIGGRKLQVVELQAASGRLEKWYFDPETGYRVRMELPGNGGPLVIDFDDFRQAAGARVKEAFRVTRTEGGRSMTVTMQLILYNEDMDQGLFAAPAGPTEDNRQVERLLANNAAFSGAEALQQVNSRVTEETVRVLTSGMETRTKVYQKRPGLIVTEQETPGLGQSWQGFDGTVGWAWSELEGYRTMQGAELQQVLATADLEGPLKLSASCPFRRLLQEKIEQGRTLTGIALATLQGPVGNFYFDARTFELVQVETFVQAGANGQLKVTADFSDYRRVDGVMIPFLMTLTNPAMKMVKQVQSVRQNVPVDDALFRPRKD